MCFAHNYRSENVPHYAPSAVCDPLRSQLLQSKCLAEFASKFGPSRSETCEIGDVEISQLERRVHSGPIASL